MSLRAGRISSQTRLLGAAIASALGFLHKNGLFHCDVKLANIIFVNGMPKLADVGLVTDDSKDRSCVGTEGFLAPEGSGTIRCDIYALAQVLYEISTGKDRNEYPALPEFPGSRAETRDLILLNEVILKACHQRAWQRSETADERMLALLAFQFDKAALRRRKNSKLLTKVCGVIGAIAAFGVLGGLIWRFFWLLDHK